MKWTSTDRWAAITLAAVLLTAWNAWQDAPPHELERIPIRAAHVPKPTEFVFGEAVYDDVRVKRPKKIGTIETWVDGDRTYSWHYMGVGIRPATWPEGGPPTDEEFDAWLALPEDHEYTNDLDGYLESIRND